MSSAEFAGEARKLATSAGSMLRVFGVRRCGQHAIIDWIFRNCGTQAQVFLNNRRVGQTPFRVGARAANKPDSGHNATLLARRLSQRIATGERPFVLVSYENGFPAAAYANNSVSPGFYNSDFNAEILVIRRFVNWLPSYMRMVAARNPDKPADDLAVLEAITRGIETYKAHIIAVNASPHVVITYDRWLLSATYRAAKLADLGLVVKDNVLGNVQPYGGGSSFTKAATAPDAQALAHRWQHLKPDPQARAILSIIAADQAFMQALTCCFPEDQEIIAEILQAG